MKTLQIFIVLLGLTAQAQQMGNGFAYLEEGKWNEAALFFKNVLEDYPDNKTANICYARAVGLKGNPEMAASIFESLLEEYPEDFEIELNLAESLLWKKKYVEAEIFYLQLVAKDVTSFPALLGLANTYSNLKKYELALDFVTRALQEDPENFGAKTSRKYIKLGMASQFKKNNKQEAAIILLSENCIDFPGDTETLSVLGELYMSQKEFDKANEAYGSIKDSVVLYRGLSLVAHKLFKDNNALLYAESGVAFSVKNDSVQFLSASERLVQALIWKGKYKQARNKIDSLKQRYPKNKTVLSLEATVSMYTAKFAKSIAQYEMILSIDSTSFDGNLGIANAYRAKGEITIALFYADKTLQFYPDQKDAITLIETIKYEMLPEVKVRGAVTVDNGDNEAWSYGASLHIPISERLKTFFSYGYRTTTNSTINTMANSTEFTAGAVYRVVNNVRVHSSLSVIKANANSEEYSNMNGSLKLAARPLPNQFLSVGYHRELQDFNASLIEEKIFMNNFNLSHNISSNFGLGWYTSYTYTTQTDANERNLLFTSLYYKLSKRPAIKGGVNYQYMGFANQVPQLYFSPSKYQSLEVFAEANGKLGAVTYMINSAIGRQFVENDAASSLFRIEARTGMTLAKNLNGFLYGKYSNIASATASGFSFSEVGFQISWKIGKKSGKKAKAENELIVE
ncbi:MAG: tetratricopeptide (TPR) repeat protein [Planctomycetota bacterium]|jgi:tetratricopeptide (TPR) repeat protein|uniref:tetratricopeptide repeat protein n=1 Tax=Patiriisocius sp. Uisw_047 TaxID=3230969 RepID=UPI0039EC115B